MVSNRRNLDWMFAGVVALLAALAVFSSYHNRKLPQVIGADAPENAEVPRNHPSVDLAGRLEDLQQLSRNHPQDAEYQTQIGNVYYDIGQYRKAVSAYQESLRLRPADPNVETDLATCYHYLSEPDKALEILDHVLQYRPDFPQALYNKGIVLDVDKRDPKAAVAVWERLLQANPDYPDRAGLERRIRQLKESLR